MKMSGLVSDVQPVKEDQLTKELVKLLSHVTETSNILVSTILRAVVSAELAHKVQDGLSDKIDSDAIELDKPVTASQGSMKTPGLVSDVLQTKEEPQTKETVLHLLHVTKLDNISEFTTHNHVDNADTAHKVQDGLLDKIDSVVIE